MYSIGIDIGSVAAKGIIFNGDIVNQVIIPTGWSPRNASLEVLNLLLKSSKIERDSVKIIIGTGYGRVSMDFADKCITEITCHGKGAYFLNSKIRTILDIGGQDSKVISLDDNGNVREFLMNDKCAAGTGRFLQVMANLLGVDVEDLDDIAENSSPQLISSMCTVFAESEIISLLAQGVTKKSLAAGILQSIANRGVNLLNKIGLQDDIAFTGGVAKSKVLTQYISKKIKKDIYVPNNSQVIGALGAAVIGWNMLK